MRPRLLALLPTVILLVYLLPAWDSDAAADPPPEIVVDEIEGLPAADDPPPRSSGQVSEPTRTPIAFSMLAFTAPPGARVSFRTSTDGEHWSAWLEAEVPESGPDHGTSEALLAAPDHRRSGEPTWVGEAAWVQVRVEGAPLVDVDVDLIDSMGLSRSLWDRAGDALRVAWRGDVGTARAEAAPTIVTRRQWGADESLRSGKPAYASAARYGVLHHTVGTNSYTREQAPGVVRGIYAYHTRSRGWSDIGYNFLVDRFGTVYEGRHGGVDAAVIGAHTLGFNTGSIGVALMGNHDTAGVPRATRRAVVKLFAWKFAVHGIDPQGSVPITSTCVGGGCKHARGTVLTLPTLFGHRDVGYTNCPGTKGYAALPALRAAILDRQVDVLANHGVSPGTARLSASGFTTAVDFRVDLVPGGPWDFVVKYDDGTVMYEQSGKGRTAKVRWAGRAGIPEGTYWYKFTSRGRTPAIGTFTVKAAAYAPPFSDDDTSVHVEGIHDLYERGITKGCTVTTFCPARSVSRGQMASFVSRSMSHLGMAQRSATRDWFSDDRGSVHEPAINTLTESGVSSGCAHGRFCPGRPILRGDMAEWIARAFDLEPRGIDHFSDDDGTSYEWAINALADVGLTTGCTQDRYCPDEDTSRGQMASFLSRTIAESRAGGLGR